MNIYNTISIKPNDVPGLTSQIDMKPINSSFICEKSDISITDNKTLTIDNIDYFVGLLSDKGNKGAHSLILKLYINNDNNREDSNLVLKVSNSYDNWTPHGAFRVNKHNYSFYREIECLQKCKNQCSHHIIPIHFWGHLICKKKSQDGKDVAVLYPFYMMDCANYDLKQFLENNEIDKKEKLLICYQISSGLAELHNLGCYHRDIKPDNILLFDKEFKIGDLGLIRYRNEDIEDAKGIIGPKGWISPEAMNKYLNQDKVFDRRINIEINEQSDIFQLGMVFWYIFQGNAPVGCIKRNDFFDKNDMIFSLIKRMIYHSTEKRITSIDKVKEELSHILDKI